MAFERKRNAGINIRSREEKLFDICLNLVGIVIFIIFICSYIIT